VPPKVYNETLRDVYPQDWEPVAEETDTSPTSPVELKEPEPVKQSTPVETKVPAKKGDTYPRYRMSTNTETDEKGVRLYKYDRVTLVNGYEVREPIPNDTGVTSLYRLFYALAERDQRNAGRPYVAEKIEGLDSREEALAYLDEQEKKFEIGLEDVRIARENISLFFGER
jgi:hypothetical protein